MHKNNLICKLSQADFCINLVRITRKTYSVSVTGAKKNGLQAMKLKHRSYHNKWKVNNLFTDNIYFNSLFIQNIPLHKFFLSTLMLGYFEK
jgi:hypothetical protein